LRKVHITFFPGFGILESMVPFIGILEKTSTVKFGRNRRTEQKEE
jgi:hypothetical protein